jgi:hypothetical protein
MTQHIPIAAISFAALSFISAMSPGVSAQGRPLAPADAVFTATLSNTTPLVFGMHADAAARALGVPLTYLRGRPGEEVYLAMYDLNGRDFFPRKGKLFLQFRKGRLTGWKGDWGQNWMWE